MELPLTPLPSAADLDRLVVAVRDAGGSDLPQPHLGAELPELDAEGFDLVRSAGCGHATLFVRPGAHGLKDALTACAVCDAATLWPVMA